MALSWEDPVDIRTVEVLNVEERNSCPAAENNNEANPAGEMRCQFPGCKDFICNPTNKERGQAEWYPSRGAESA